MSVFCFVVFRGVLHGDVVDQPNRSGMNDDTAPYVFGLTPVGNILQGVGIYDRKVLDVQQWIGVDPFDDPAFGIFDR